MKIVDQYLIAVGSRLPWRTAKDIADELRSLLLDQIEADYGPDPSEEQVKKAILEFGSPGEVAARYREEKPVIASGLKDLYCLIALILAGAMLISFTTVFLVANLPDMPSGTALFKAILKIPVNAISAWISGFGVLTLVFIGMSRLKPFTENPVDTWSINQLDEITIQVKSKSRIESVITISFLVAVIVLMNFHPQVVTYAENLFDRIGVAPGHRIIIAPFRKYIRFLTVLWSTGILIQILILYRRIKTRTVKWMEIAVSAGEALLMMNLLRDRGLYYNASGWVGIKVVFVIVLIVNLAELTGSLFRLLRARITGIDHGV